MVVVVANLFLFGRSSILILIFQETPHRHLLFLQRFDFFFLYARVAHPGSKVLTLKAWFGRFHIASLNPFTMLLYLDCRLGIYFFRPITIL